MNFESEPKPNTQESTPEEMNVPEDSVEKKEYELERFSTGWKALGAIDIGMLSTLKEAIFTKEEKWQEREEETGEDRKLWALKHLAKKTFDGYQAMEKAEEIVNESNFQEIVDNHEEKVGDSINDEEREKLQKDLEGMRNSRDKKIDKEKKKKSVRNSLFDTFANVLK